MLFHIGEESAAIIATFEEQKQSQDLMTPERHQVQDSWVFSGEANTGPQIATTQIEFHGKFLALGPRWPQRFHLYAQGTPHESFD